MITSLLSTITRLVSITNDLKTELHGLKTKFDNEMALSKDREQRLTNRLSVLEKMLSNHGEMVQKNNDGIKSIESSLAASKEAVSRTDGKAMREERPRNTVSSLTTTTQQKTWADACKEETSDSESTQLSEAHGSKIKKRKRKLMPPSSTSKDIQHNASNVKQVHSSTGDPNRSRTVGGVRLRQELEIRQLSKYNLPKWESEASDDEPLWKLVTNRKPGPPTGGHLSRQSPRGNDEGKGNKVHSEESAICWRVPSNDFQVYGTKRETAKRWHNQNVRTSDHQEDRPGSGSRSWILASVTARPGMEIQ